MEPTGRHLTDESALRRLLEEAGVRATTQRMGLARLLFGGHDRHVVASELYLEAVQAGLGVSLATVYNTLGQFVQAGLLHEVRVDADKTYFDTHVRPHGHIYDETTGDLTDVVMPNFPLPDGVDADQVVATEVIFRIRTPTR
ncbi:MAG: transcriptional repressor [Myxococcota bacterium]